jgi:hypothetical protein
MRYVCMSMCVDFWIFIDHPFGINSLKPYLSVSKIVGYIAKNSCSVDVSYQIYFKSVK